MELFYNVIIMKIMELLYMTIACPETVAKLEISAGFKLILTMLRSLNAIKD